MTSSLVISIISLSLCVSGFFFLRWYISKRTDASRLLEEYRDEVSRLITEIHAATDRDELLVEERIKTLRKLLDDTEKRISVYTREIQRSRNSEAIYKKLGSGIREALDSIPVSSQKTTSQKTPSGKAPPPVEINELPFSDEEKAPKTASVKKQRKRRTVKTPPQKKLPEKPGKKRQIAQMALQGFSPSDIASNLGISLAEVDLALQLLNMNSKEENY
jgi:transposase-like protein